MSEKVLYRYDYSDPAFPDVRIATEDGVTFSEAKERAIESALSNLEHWKQQVAYLRKLKKTDVAK